MDLLVGYGGLSQRFLAVADFALVYLMEAHPSDGWQVRIDNDVTQIYRSSSLYELPPTELKVRLLLYFTILILTKFKAFIV
jgi:hypothetical protein